jgi:hypothetical protein
MSRSISTGHTLIDEEKKETLKKQPGMGWNGLKWVRNCVNLSRACICKLDSQPGGPVRQVRQSYLMNRPTELYMLSESIPWNQFLGSLKGLQIRAQTATFYRWELIPLGSEIKVSFKKTERGWNA